MSVYGFFHPAGLCVMNVKNFTKSFSSGLGVHWSEEGTAIELHVSPPRVREDVYMYVSLL